MRWMNKISLYLVALSIQAFVVYPDMSAESIKASWDDGTFWFKLFFVVIAVLATRGAARLRVPPK